MRRNIGFALVASKCTPGEEVQVAMRGGSVSGRLVEPQFEQ
jgi:hypothetical protein